MQAITKISIPTRKYLMETRFPTDVRLEICSPDQSHASHQYDSLCFIESTPIYSFFHISESHPKSLPIWTQSSESFLILPSFSQSHYQISFVKFQKKIDK
jgi:hypothetical protein